jgi:hypothetical protein
LSPLRAALQLNYKFASVGSRRNLMTGAEIVIGVIIGVLFELWSNAEGTPLENLAGNSIAK